VIPISRIVIGHCEEFPEDSTILDQVLERISIPQDEKKDISEMKIFGRINLESIKKTNVELADKFMEKGLMREDFGETLKTEKRKQKRPVGVSINE